MATITKITTQKKSNERFNVYLDQGAGEEYGFSIDQDVLINFGLQKGSTLDDDLLEQLMSEDAVKKGFNQAVVYLSYRMRSEKEVKDYLVKKEFAKDTADTIIHKLQQFGYVNDLDFAKMFVRSKKNTSSKGPFVIRQELKQKGISNVLIEQSLKEYPFEEQVASAVKFANKKGSQKKSLSTLQLKQKLGQALAGKGYAWEVISAAMEEIEFTKDESQEWEALHYQGLKAHRKYSKKYDGWEFERRMKQFLYGKGFSADLIERWIQELDKEDG
jgi:regulatory protein